MSRLQPILLDENRVWRIYLGGKLLDEFHGRTPGQDGYFPEDWLASVVVARNPEREGKPEGEGLSRVAGSNGETALRDLILEDPQGYLGEAHIAKLGSNFGVLTKFLDSAERLPIQVHPDKQQAKKLFSSDYGKTEAWYILDGRVIDGVEPYILMGFKEDVPRETLQELFDKQDIKGMEQLMHRIPVKAGEVYLIEGGTPHAIGSGCFILEIQEPTDYTISLEKCNTLGEKLPDFLCHMGLGFEKMFDCFHYEGQTLAQLQEAYCLEQKVLEKTEAYTLTNLIPYTRTACFALNRLDVYMAFEKTPSSACALVVIAGEGNVGDNNVKKGDCLFVPAGAQPYRIAGDGLVLLECMPPQVNC